MKNDVAPFQKINDAARITGFSRIFIRNGCKSGWIPHVMSGNSYMVNVPAFLEIMEERSKMVPLSRPRPANLS